ncbi:hypothetical protein J6590_035646 [Homalodisca vitripennis]|nr:hypothetical protein J6590_035646 [Homalodisca vitripennis]
MFIVNLSTKVRARVANNASEVVNRSGEVLIRLANGSGNVPRIGETVQEVEQRVQAMRTEKRIDISTRGKSLLLCNTILHNRKYPCRPFQPSFHWCDCLL